LLSSALVTGLLAGFGLALPLGAIGILLVQEGMLRGWMSGSTAALAVALVDCGYSLAAATTGARLGRTVAGIGDQLRVGAGIVLWTVAGYGLARLWRGRRHLASAAEAEPGGESEATRPGAAAIARTFARFLGLTAINPMTAIYFLALATGLGQSSSLATGKAGPILAFALGVLVGSAGWQLTLAGFGSLAGRRLPGWARRATTLVGNLLVLGYGAALVFG
jgi:arginine exporter protein ArgO